jgi:uncharacterized membrane protein YkoI
MMSKPNVILLASVSVLTLSQALAEQGSQAGLQAQAKISREEATNTARAHVPNGNVVSAELEREHGKLVWSFDLAQSGKPGATEIQVDALTGKIVSVKHESAEQEAAEASKEGPKK